MVKSVTNLTRSGVADWLIQRVTAIILAVYSVFLLSYLLLPAEIDYAQWYLLFASPVMKIASIITLVALLAHAWIGVWTIATDYLKHTAIRLIFLLACALASMAYLLWGIDIFWGL